MSYSHLDPGRELEICGHLYSNQMDLSELVQLTPAELSEREDASVEQEKAIYAKMLEIEKEWVQQAAQTLALWKARQYQRTPPARHTSNKWETGQYDWHERSNMVYKFTWHVYENSSWSRAEQKSIVHSYDLSWYLTYNTPREPDYTGPGRQIAGQERKRFTDKASLDKYLQGRVKAYDHLFTEISPPIPAEEKRRFCVNGVLLPGYTVEITMDQAVSDLLAMVEDDDLAALAQDDSPKAPVLENRKEAPAKRPTHSKLHKRKCAPTR